MSGLRRALADLRTAVTMPGVQIVLSRGEPDDDEVLHRFRRPHPRLKLVGAKPLDAALMPLDEFADADAYLARVRFVRKRARRCARLGYTVARFHPVERAADLLAIHASLPERQGRPIDLEYLDPDAVAKRGPNVEYLGVWQDGTVTAHIRLDYVGDIAGMGRVMGHGAQPRQGRDEPADGRHRRARQSGASGRATCSTTRSSARRRGCRRSSATSASGPLRALAPRGMNHRVSKTNCRSPSWRSCAPHWCQPTHEPPSVNCA